jgi:serine/threonine protein phosphatase PrpC
MYRKQFITSGTTALVLLVDGYSLALANVGDSRALLIQSKGATFINEPHVPALPRERDRILACMSNSSLYLDLNSCCSSDRAG